MLIRWLRSKGMFASGIAVLVATLIPGALLATLLWWLFLSDVGLTWPLWLQG